MRLSLTLVCLTTLEKCPEQKLGFEVVAGWYSERLAMQLNLYSSQCTQSLQECIWLSAFHHNKLLQRKTLNPLTTDDGSTVVSWRNPFCGNTKCKFVYHVVAFAIACCYCLLPLLKMTVYTIILSNNDQRLCQLHQCVHKVYYRTLKEHTPSKERSPPTFGPISCIGLKFTQMGFA